jgi:hypothetical protein
VSRRRLRRLGDSMAAAEGGQSLIREVRSLCHEFLMDPN